MTLSRKVSWSAELAANSPEKADKVYLQLDPVLCFFFLLLSVLFNCCFFPLQILCFVLGALLTNVAVLNWLNQAKKVINLCCCRTIMYQISDVALVLVLIYCYIHVCSYWLFLLLILSLRGKNISPRSAFHDARIRYLCTTLVFRTCVCMDPMSCSNGWNIFNVHVCAGCCAFLCLPRFW